MSNVLAHQLATWIREEVASAFSQLPDARSELRSFFHGPPLEHLGAVYDILCTDGFLNCKAMNGEEITVPVLLQLRQTLGSQNPLLGQSGKCDESHLLNLRNSPACRQYLVLVPPDQHRNLSITSASTEFGVSAACNTSNASFQDWFRDPLIQRLIAFAITEFAAKSDGAHALVEVGMRASELMGSQGGGRASAWNVLSRLLEAKASKTIGVDSASALSLACGFPPSEKGIVDSAGAIQALEHLADALSDGFKTGIERIRQSTNDPEDLLALDGCLIQLQSSCQVLTAFERATPAFYAPFGGTELATPPSWWKHLTIEKWIELLEEEVADKSGLTIRVTNSLAPPVKGGCALVANVVELAIANEGDGASGVDVNVKRVSSVRGAQQSSWVLSLPGNATAIDDQPPPHGTPLRYTADAIGFKPALLKVLSLSTWTPGIYISSRTATKLTPTRATKANKEKIAYEATLHLTGAGRHYIDLWVARTVSLNQSVVGRDAGGEDLGANNINAQVEKVDELKWGFEVDIPGDCFLDFGLIRKGSLTPELVRLHITCGEVVVTDCRSEFERVIGLNRLDDRARAKQEVHVNRHARCSDLQSWMLEPANIQKSFMPVVLAEDYVDFWAAPNWSLDTGPILSAGSFLHDPRPRPIDFEPSAKYLEARTAIAERIRGDDGTGLVEAAALGDWIGRDEGFSQLIEIYLDEYLAWLSAAPETAAWSDLILVASLNSESNTLEQVPEAIILSPLHPVRLAWHCVAHKILLDAVKLFSPCPAASILDPDCVPDVLALPLRLANGGILYTPFISVEVDTDYWGVLWNGTRLNNFAKRSQDGPFGVDFGIQVGGVSSGFSPAQVMRALDDATEMFSAKPRLNVLIASSSSSTDACTAGIFDWAGKQWGKSDEENSAGQSLGPRMLDVFDTRKGTNTGPDEAAISNLTEDTNGAVRWFRGRPNGAVPDLGIIAQLESAAPTTEFGAENRSPLSAGALIRHKIRRQLPGGQRAFLSESKQGYLQYPRSDSLVNKVATAVARLENLTEAIIDYSFAPNVHAIKHVLNDEKAVLVAVSSSTIDPACFLGQWLGGACLWDYDLPSYSRRAGDTNGYYLISQIRESEKEGLKKVLSRLPGCSEIADDHLSQILLEISRRGIPTIRGISGHDSGGTGDLGLFVAARLLQDQFRETGGTDSLLKIVGPIENGVELTLVVPVDPFRGYLDDLSRALRTDKKDGSLSRPDLLVVCVRLVGETVSIRLTPVEVKCRQSGIFPAQASVDALRQAATLSGLFSKLKEKAENPDLLIWKLAYQHLLLSMIGFGLRVYSQQLAANHNSRAWSQYHERIALEILGDNPTVEIDLTGRLIVIDKSSAGEVKDIDADGFAETIVLGAADSGEIVVGDPRGLYEAIQKRVGDWRLMPTTQVKGTENGVLNTFGTDRAIVPPVLAQSTAPPENSTAEHSEVAPAVELPLNNSEHMGKEVESPTNDEVAAKGIELRVGSSFDAFRDKERVLNISDTRLNQLNIGVVGDLGTGKTQLLKSLIYQIANSARQNAGTAPRFLIFDYKKDYASDDFVNSVGAKVVKPYRLPINLFDTSDLEDSATPWLDRFSFFADVLDKIYSGIGPVQRGNLKQAVRKAYEVAALNGKQPTIYDVHSEYRTILNGKLDSPFAIIDDLVDREVFSREPAEGAGFKSFFDGVVVISLGSLGQDDRAKNMLVAAMLNMFYEHMLKVPKRAYRGSDPQLRVIDSYLLVDEADNIMQYEFDVLKKVLLQGREFGVGVILASQYLKHFKVNASDYREPLLTWFIHKVPNVTPQELAGLGLTADFAELASRVKQLPNHHCLYKSANVGGEVILGMPFYRIIQER